MALDTQTGGPEGDDERIGDVEVVDHDVEVDLLRPRGVTPHRRHVVRRELERQPAVRGVRGDDDPLRTVEGDRPPEHRGPELREGVRLAGVQRHVVHPADRPHDARGY